MTKTFGYLSKNQRILWVCLRVIILLWGIYGLFHGSVVEFLEAIFAIIFTHLWDFFQIFGKKSFIIEVDASTRSTAHVESKYPDYKPGKPATTADPGLDEEGEIPDYVPEDNDSEDKISAIIEGFRSFFSRIINFFKNIISKLQLQWLFNII